MVDCFVIQNCVGAQGDHILSAKSVLNGGASQETPYLQWCHDTFYLLRVQFQDTIQDVDFIITERLFAGTMELEKGFELSFLVRVCLVRPKNPVQKFGDRPGNRGENPHHN